MSPAAEPAVRLPYPGLRSFQRDESDLFFGREGTVNDMINRLRPNHFLAVLGTSGSGKSSLVRIGLLDGLELGLLAEAGSRWRIVDFAPGANPLRNLADALARLSGGSGVDVDFLEAFLRRGPRSVVEWCKDGHLPAGANLLLLVDQFEELFRFEDYAERQEAEAFVALLIESARNREVPIYVVITMRSEYLGACALIEGLAEIINDGQFLTPRLNRDQCREAIVGPASVCGTKIEEILVNRLLNDLEDFAPWDDRDFSDQLDRLVRRADQLPLLQHTLNRLWLRADAIRGDNRRPITLRLGDYDAIGGLRGAINAHADEILAKLALDLQARAEQAFRALTDGKSLATAVRRPLRFDELVAVCDGDEPGVRAVVDAFRESGVNFLRPDSSLPLLSETIVDISHESLIRQWRRLSNWVIEEAREGQEWMRLGEAAARYRAGEGALWRGQDLHQWKERSHPTAAWAARYDQPYEQTLAFLDESVRTDVRSRRLRQAAIAAGLVVVVGFGGGGFFFSQLAGKNAALEAQQAELATANQALLATSTELETNNAALIEAQAELAESVERLQATRQQLRNVFLGSFDADVGAYQHSRDWAGAGALLGAMLDRTSHVAEGGRFYNDAVLEAARLRLAEQWTFPSWREIAPAGETVRTTSRLHAAGRFGLSSADAGEGASVRLVDLLTGAVLAETLLPAGMQPNPDAPSLIAPDGKDAIILTESGYAVRWRTGDGRHIDYGVVDEAGAPVVALAFDQASERLALLRYVEDSEVVVFGPEAEVLLRAPLSGIEGMDETAENDVEAEAQTLDGTGVSFWADDVLVSFAAGDKNRFAALDVEGVAGDLLPDDLEAVMPSSDGRWLFVETSAGCHPENGVAPVGPDGAIIEPLSAPRQTRGLELLPPTCLGALASPDGEIEIFGALGASRDGSSIAAVLSGASEDAADRYRLVIDRSVRTPSSFDPALLAIDFAAADGSLVLADVADARADASVQMPLTGDDGATVFAKAFPVDPWRPMPKFTTAKTLTWFDPVAEETVRLADVLRAPAGEEPSLALLPSEVEWPADKLGPFPDIHVASAGGAFIVVSGNHGGIQWFDAGAMDLTLREITFGRECRLPAGENLDLSRLLAWSASAPAFFGLDADGRVLRFSAQFGGRGPEASTAGGAGVQVNCLGQLRADFTGVAIADGASEVVLLQTDPQEYAVLPANMETEKEFNEAETIGLPVASLHAALVPGERPTLATLDRGGNLTVLRADPDWRVLTESRSVVVAAPTHASVANGRLLVVGEAGRATIVDLSTENLLPVAAGVVPHSGTGYRLLADGRTVEVMRANGAWRVPLPALPALTELARYAEATASALADSSDQDQVSLGERLMTADDEGAAISEGTAGMLLGGDALCYLAANAVLEAWKAEAGQGAPGARLEAARREAEIRCGGSTALARAGRILARASHYISPALDAWPVEWSMLLGDALAGNRLALRALLIGLSNSADPFASVAGEWFAGSRAAFGLELPEAVFQSAVSGGMIDPELREIVNAQRETYEPAIHELLGHIAEQKSAGSSDLKQAWLNFRIAEVLYSYQVGRSAEAERTAHLRSTVARALSAEELLAAWSEANSWTADVATSASAAPAALSGSMRERIRADAERIAAHEPEGGADAPFVLLEAYLWLSLAEIEAAEAPAEASASYGRFADILTSLPSPDELPAPIAAALVEAGSSLVDLASAGRLGDPATATRLTPVILGLAEPEQEGTWDVASLRSYASTLEALAKLLSAEEEIPADVLDRLVFAERRFGHNFRVETDADREAARVALDARLALVDVLLTHDPSRSDWLAAKGTTEFWIGYRLHDADPAGRTEWLALAIRDLASAQEIAGAEFPAESLYWLTEARRWLPAGADAAPYLDLIAGGRSDYETLRDAYEAGGWDAPVAAAELFASNAELLAKIADAGTRLVFDRGDDWEPNDPVVQEQILGALWLIAEWDAVREMAVNAGSTWTSMNPGFPIAPGYLLATVGGHASAMAGSGDACDGAASFAGDPLRRAPSVAYEDIDISSASGICRERLSESEEDPRLNYLMNRLLSGTADRRGLGLDTLQVAAEAGYPAAFNSLAGYLEDAGATVPDAYAMELDARFGYAQRVIKASFDDIHAYVAPLAVTEDHRKGLRWLIDRGAVLGSPAAHLLLADLPDLSQEDRYFHLEIAATLLEGQGEEARAEAIRADIPPENYVDAADRAEDEFRIEPLVGLPEGIFDLLKGVTN